MKKNIVSKQKPKTLVSQIKDLNARQTINLYMILGIIGFSAISVISASIILINII